jgi:polyisoprenoid-binding protein YceI
MGVTVKTPPLRLAPRRLGAAALALCLLAACAQPPQRSPAEPAAGGGSASASQLPGWPVVAEESLLTVRVWRGGRLAALGHNHVIASHDLAGSVRIGPTLEASSVEIGVPVASLTVDEPALRAQAGADFAAAVPDSARSGTRTNMLGPALLDAANFERISLHSTGVTAAPGGALLDLEVTVKGKSTLLHVPVAILRDPGRIVADGELELRQTALGLEPFSVLMGALQVEDAMKLRFHIVARRAP